MNKAKPVNVNRVHRTVRPAANWHEWIQEAPQARSGFQPAPAGPVPWPSQEAIARLAYAKWEARGGPHGSDKQDWLEAEQELLRERLN